MSANVGPAIPASAKDVLISPMIAAAHDGHEDISPKIFQRCPLVSCELRRRLRIGPRVLDDTDRRRDEPHREQDETRNDQEQERRARSEERT